MERVTSVPTCAGPIRLHSGRVSVSFRDGKVSPCDKVSGSKGAVFLSLSPKTFHLRMTLSRFHLRGLNHQKGWFNRLLAIGRGVGDRFAWVRRVFGSETIKAS